MTDPVPRSGDNGLTVGPCGGVPAGAPTPFTAGETITVSWAVGQAHGGSLTIDFSAADDMNFRSYVLATDVSDADGMPTSIDVELPNIDCDACTLRLTQVNPNDDEYYSCADIALSGASATGSTGGSDSSGGADSSGGGSTTDPGSESGVDETAGDSGSASASASATDPSAGEAGGSTDGSSGLVTDSEVTVVPGDDDSDSGCGCRSTGGGSPWWLGLGLGLAVRRRRR